MFAFENTQKRDNMVTLINSGNAASSSAGNTRTLAELEETSFFFNFLTKKIPNKIFVKEIRSFFELCSSSIFNKSGVAEK